MHRNRYEQCLKRFRNVKTTLSTSHDLSRIVKAASRSDAADLRAFLLEGLAYAAFDPFESSASTAGAMRRRGRRLKSFAGQMRTAAKFAKHLAESPDSILDLDAKNVNYNWCGPELIEAMEECAKLAVFQAGAFGRYTRRRPDRWANAIVLAEHVRKETNRTFYPELARLLTDAHEVAKTPRIFSADQIRKIVERSRRSHGVLRPNLP